MAKNCINSACEKEIPSNATYCSYCGTPQVENENATEWTKLLEAEKEIKRLNKSLDLAHKHIDEGSSEKLKAATAQIAQKGEELKTVQIAFDNATGKIEKLYQENEALIEALNSNNKILSDNKNEITRLKSATVKKESVKKIKKKNWIIWFLCLIIVALFIIAISFFYQYSNYENYFENDERILKEKEISLHTYKNKLDSLQKQVSINDPRVIRVEVRHIDVDRKDGARFNYSGTLKNGLPNGYGSAIYEGEKIYDGHFVDGYRNGEGTMTYSDGKIWEGEWEMDTLIDSCLVSIHLR